MHFLLSSRLATTTAIALATGLVALTSGAAATPVHTHTLDIVNRVPQFKRFYADATAKPLDEAARWALWQKEYGIAAVPPGPEGQKIARKQLDDVWSRYPALIRKADTLEAKGAAEAKKAFASINTLFKTDDTPINTRVVLYVGQFDGNAYTVPPMGGQPSTIMMPVETEHVVLAHELTHSVNNQLAHVKNGFGAPVGETMFMEGLAMHTAQKVAPGLPERDYVAMAGDKNWLKRCYARKQAVLTAIASDLDKSGSKIALKYTFGNGNTGMHREVYCAAWIVMGRLLKSGKSYAELARIPEDRMVATIRTAVAAEIASF